MKILFSDYVVIVDGIPAFFLNHILELCKIQIPGLSTEIIVTYKCVSVGNLALINDVISVFGHSF